MKFILSIFKKLGVNLIQERKPWVCSYRLAERSKITLVLSVSDDAEFIGNVVIRHNISRSVANTSIYSMTSSCTTDNLFTWFDAACEQFGIAPDKGNERFHGLLAKYFEEYKYVTRVDEQSILTA